MKKTKAATKKRRDGVRGSVKKAGRIITPKERERERGREEEERDGADEDDCGEEDDEEEGGKRRDGVGMRERGGGSRRRQPPVHSGWRQRTAAPARSRTQSTVTPLLLVARCQHVTARSPVPSPARSLGRPLTVPSFARSRTGFAEREGHAPRSRSLANLARNFGLWTLLRGRIRPFLECFCLSYRSFLISRSSALLFLC